MIINKKMWSTIEKIQIKGEDKFKRQMSDMEITVVNSYSNRELKIRKDYIQVDIFYNNIDPVEIQETYKIFEDGTKYNLRKYY